jgi:hypothetical protein
MTQFGVTPRSVERVLQLDGKRYFLANAGEASQVEGARRAWDVKRVPRQDGDPTQEFTVPLTSFHNGYGYTFAGESGVYEVANGWDLSAPGKAISYPRLTTAEAADSGANYRGWLYWNAPSGYMYLLRGSYSYKYLPDDTSDEWPIIERHYFGANIVVAGKPAEFQSKLYVPLVDITDPDNEVLSEWHELETFSTTTPETQTLTESGSPTGGTWAVTFNNGTSTQVSGLAFNISAADLQTQLRTIPGLEGVTVSRTGTTTNFVWTVLMTGAPSVSGTTSPAQFTASDSLTGGAAETITPATTIAGVGDEWNPAASGVEARTFTTWQKPTVGPVLVRANANKVSSCSTVPVIADNWGTEQEVGDTGADITALATLGRLLFVGKEDGVWSFDETGQAISEIPAIAAIRDPQNCIGMSEYNGYLLIPHKLGLIRWRPGSSWGIVGAEQEGVYEGERSSGWGSVSGLAPYGKYCYQTVNDLYNGLGIVGSLQAPGGPRGSLTPHMHQSFGSFVEDCAVVGLSSQPTSANIPDTWSDDNAVGTITWSNPSSAASTSAFASAAEGGTTHYLKGLNPNPAVPSGATIKGIRLELTRQAISPSTTSTTFSYTGASQNYLVPTGVTTITVDVKGASGGGEEGDDGGRGGRVQTTLSVTPGETLTVRVAGAGTDSGTGGYNGGGNGGTVTSGTRGAGGGGASDIRRAADRLVVAGGGGGATSLDGGAAGGTTGSTGGGFPGFTGSGGGGGTSSAGGAGGAKRSDDPNANNGVAGSSATGGAGGSTTNSGSGGGGGGGYFGGGGGGAGGGGGGGGGGSSFSSGSSTVHTANFQSGNGQVIVTAAEATDIVDDTVRLVKAGTVVGDDYAKSGQWSQTATAAVYGSATDLWGTTWTAAEVNAATFGFVLSAIVTNGTARINNATMFIYYSVGGVSDPGSFLAVITLDATRTEATPFIYKLPRSGMPAANDPNISKAISDASFTTARYSVPTRNTQKEYRSVELYVDLEPELDIPGLQMWASVEDGEFFPLLDADGAAATPTLSGHEEVFFPTTAGSIGRWVQLRPTVPALAGDEVAVAVDLRDVTIHGAWLPKKTEEITAVVVLKEGGQHQDGYTDPRSLAEQKADLEALDSPRETGAGPVVLRDPITRTEGRCVVTNVTLRPMRFKDAHEETYVAVITMRKAVTS